MTDHNTDLAIECYTRAESMTQLAQLRVACRAQLAYGAVIANAAFLVLFVLWPAFGLFVFSHSYACAVAV